MAHNKREPRQMKLFHLITNELWNDEDEKMEASYRNLMVKIKDLSDKETHDALVAMVSQNSYDDICIGLLYGILTNPNLALKHYRDLALITRDSFVLLVSKLNWVLIEMYQKLQETPKIQLIWLIKEAVKSNVPYMESVCVNLMRNVIAGNPSHANMWLAENLLNIFTENKAWLDKNPTMIGYAVYFFLRHIPDHVSLQHEPFRNKEIKFCIAYLRERFIDCLNVISRELGRALAMVSRIPEFEKLWLDIMLNPTVLSPQFSGLWQLLSAPILISKRTVNKIVLCRLSVEIERKIYFFLNNVPASGQKIYLDWLKNYLQSVESQSVRSDLIRYICCLVHPSNTVLASDIVPRWSLITWLLTTCQNPIEFQLMKLSLFYDWLFFDPEKDSIMNIEPGILLVFNCLRTHAMMASGFMDFLCRTAFNFAPSVFEQVKSCVCASFKQLLDKKVVASLAPLFDSPKFDADLNALIREVFDEFCSPREDDVIVVASTLQPGLTVPTPAEESGPLLDVAKVLEDEKFSEDETETPETEVDAENSNDALAKRQANPFDLESDLINPLDDPAPVPLSDTQLQQLDPTLQPLLIDLQKMSDDDYVRGDSVYKILIQMLGLDSFDEDQASVLADCLCGLFRPFFARRVFPKQYENESDLDDTLQAPIFVIFRNLCLTPEEEMASRRPQLLLTSEMYLRQPRIGYLMLYFLIFNNTGSDKMSPYKDMCKMLDEDVDDLLIKDLTLCQQDDYRLFIYMVPHIYKRFTQFAQQSSDLMHLIVSTVDAVQLQDIICEIVQGNLTLFRKDCFTSLLNASLNWETIEQYFFWQLINAEDVPLDWAIPIIAKLNFPAHAEAMANVVLMLKRLDKEPTMLLIRSLFGREPYKKADLFSVSALKILIDDFEDKMIDLITSLLQKTSAESNSQKIKKATAAKVLTLDSVLGHLDMFRQINKQGHAFFTKDTIQQAFQDVRKSAPESLKSKFSELFSMMEILDSVKDGRHRRSRKAPAQHDSSDDEKRSKSPIKPVVKKKRKVLDSDSD